ncbi:hypothetical protein GCM10022255_096600 [Dactylosporangium darangshiense]|uniref:Galactose oxidase n=2 Tax=Dactylosporangium darangshiense TaxID=579108 RepID=A0ABP8DQN6_9ACTN
MGRSPGTPPPSVSQPAIAGWREADSAGRVPQPRDGHWMAGDTNGRVILFGGKGAGSRYFNDTWTYTPATSTWTELTPAGTLPPGRFGHGLVHDPADHRILLFGGVATTGLANDLWAYDLTINSWTPVEPAGVRPPARLYPSMAYDPATRKAVVFGGWTGNSEFADTWVYDPAANRWSEVHSAGGPHARWGSSMVYDAATGTMILFGGLFGSYDGSSRLNDTWEYDPTTGTWKNLSPVRSPSTRGYASMVYDSATDKVILFGGFAGSDGLLGDTWEYDHTANTWNRLIPGPADPPRRDFSAAVYDPRADTTILFGGLTGNAGNVDGTLLNDTWRRP